MIKPWKNRVEEAAHFREEDYINDVQYFMQAEIDEMRDENARLKAALLTNDTTIESANNAAGMLEAENARLKAVPMKYKRMAFNAELQAENARLRAALTTARTALIEHGSAYLHHELRYQEALDAARAALGNKS